MTQHADSCLGSQPQVASSVALCTSSLSSHSLPVLCSMHPFWNLINALNKCSVNSLTAQAVSAKKKKTLSVLPLLS